VIPFWHKGAGCPLGGAKHQIQGQSVGCKEERGASEKSTRATKRTWTKVDRHKGVESIKLV